MCITCEFMTHGASLKYLNTSTFGQLVRTFWLKFGKKGFKYWKPI